MGRETGGFSGQWSSITIGPGSGNALTAQGNVEGTFTGDQGEGTFSLTHYMEIEPGDKSGTWSQYGLGNLNDGTAFGFRAQGTWAESGDGKFAYRGTTVGSTGNSSAVEFETNVAAKTMVGKFYEWN